MPGKALDPLQGGRPDSQGPGRPRGAKVLPVKLGNKTITTGQAQGGARADRVPEDPA